MQWCGALQTLTQFQLLVILELGLGFQQNSDFDLQLQSTSLGGALVVIALISVFVVLFAVLQFVKMRVMQAKVTHQFSPRLFLAAAMVANCWPFASASQ